MKTLPGLCLCTLALLLGLPAPAAANVAIASFTPSHKSPEPIGKAITWTATATDSAAGPLTFQFNILTPNSTQFALVKDFNVGTLAAGTWTSQPFLWVPTGIEGAYQIQVVIKDFTTGEIRFENRSVYRQSSGQGQPDCHQNRQSSGGIVQCAFLRSE